MNILAVGCHPDDLEIGCGGTLARYAAAGARVVLCVVANGNMGHAVIQPPELRRIRAGEVERAARILGAAEAVLLDVNDLEVDSNRTEIIYPLVELIRRVQPDVILTHAPEDYMKDHVEVSRLVFDASFSASVPHYPPMGKESSGVSDEASAAAKITPLYYMDTLAGVNFMPAEYVDISATVESKLRALDCHESQVRWMRDHDGIDFLDFVRTCAKFRGLQCGAAYAEAFRQCPTWPRLSTRRWLP